MKKIFLLVGIIVVLQVLVSCKKEEDIIYGKWPSMKWQSENITGDVKIEGTSNALATYTISGEGSIDIVCTNYPSFWIAGVNYPMDWYYEGGQKDYKYEWLQITIEDNTAHCVFTEVPEMFHNELFVTMTAGDIFFTFLFSREEEFGESGKWAPMKWTLENKVGNVDLEDVKYLINLFVDGPCSFDLICTNYEDIWFLPGFYTPDPMEDFYNVESGWCHLSITGNVIHCELDRMEGYDPAKEFEVTAGEIVSKIYFYQKSVVQGPN